MNNAAIIEDISCILGSGVFTALPGRGNSRVGKWTTGGKNFFIKEYPHDHAWDRRASEQRVIEFYQHHGIKNIPQLYHSSVKWNYSVFNFIDGTPHYEATSDHIAQFKDFLDQVIVLSASPEMMGNAKEAFFHTATLRQQIDQRLKFLRSLEDPVLDNYLRQEFDPCLAAINFDAIADVACDNKIIVSPSDFGTHNSLLDSRHRLTFIDFEYAGRDSLPKLLGDIYWHPGSALSRAQRQEIINTYLATPKDQEIQRIVQILMGVKWSLLLLNEFVPSNLQRRIKALGNSAADAQKIKLEQLVKSQNVLKQVSDD